MKTATIAAALLLTPFLLRASMQNVVRPQAQNDTPKKGFRAEFIADLDDLQKKCIGLANEVPADKYGWRPGKGVRSFSEVYAHMAGGTYYLATFIGEQPPPSCRRISKRSRTRPKSWPSCRSRSTTSAA